MFFCELFARLVVVCCLCELFGGCCLLMFVCGCCLALVCMVIDVVGLS